MKQVNVADLPLTMQSLADLPPVLTVKEMDRLLRLSRSAAYRRIEAGQIEAFKLGERWFVPTAPLKHKLGLPPRRRSAPNWPASTTGAFVEPSKLTVKAFLLEQWLPAVEGRLRPSTRANYQTNLQVHILPALGALRLQRLTAPRIAAFYSELLADGRQDGKGLAPRPSATSMPCSIGR